MAVDTQSGPRIVRLARYPVKGLSPEYLQSIVVEPDRPFAFDRAYAAELRPGKFQPDAPRHLPKIHFLHLARHAQLAHLTTQFDADTQTLSLRRDGELAVTGSLNAPDGRALIEAYLHEFIGPELPGRPQIVSAPGHTFSDVDADVVHVINLTSLRDLEARMGMAIDPLRFRANVWIDGVPAWSELSWGDLAARAEPATGGPRVTLGAVECAVFARTDRCAATQVNPTTAARDADIPRFLLKEFGHMDFGIYAHIKTQGTLRVGDVVGLPASI